MTHQVPIMPTTIDHTHRAENDPETVKIMRDCSKAAAASANRWADNIEALHSWCKRKFEGRGQELDAFFKEQGYSDGAVEYIEDS